MQYLRFFVEFAVDAVVVELMHYVIAVFLGVALYGVADIIELCFGVYCNEFTWVDGGRVFAGGTGGVCVFYCVVGVLNPNWRW